MDMKQVIAGLSTIAMCAMLLNMISNGPFLDANQEDSDGSENIGSMYRDTSSSLEIWGRPGPVLEPCWDKRISSLTGKTWGFIAVRLSNGPQYHRLQIADAVVVSKCLGATLLVPNIKDGDKEPNGQFDKIYDTSNFITSLQNIVRVVGRVPDEMNSLIPAIINVPYGVTKDYIDHHIRPLFNQKAFVILDSFYFEKDIKEDTNKELQALRCLVMYKALKFELQLLKLGNRIITRMREAAQLSGGHFIAVDVPLDLLQKRGCSNNSSIYAKTKNKKCASPSEIAMFLNHLGFPKDTAIYLTQSRWNEELDPFNDVFPNSHTKEYSMPFNEERQILYSGKSQFEKALDFYICTQSDVFVPSVSGTFYSTVSGVRIALGKTQILVPNSKYDFSLQKEVTKSLSHYVKKKDHPVYSCFG